MPPVLTMGATNLAETLDAALLRPGRFDRKITVDPPDPDGRKEIIEYYLAKVKHEPMPLDRMVSDTIGYSPVAIKFVINEARHPRPLRRPPGDQLLGLHQGARDPRVGPQPADPQHVRTRSAASWRTTRPATPTRWSSCCARERLTKVTIVRHGGALGFAPGSPRGVVHRDKQELLNQIKISLASRAAEELFLDIQMNGVSSDLQHATQIAYACLKCTG